jgi:hypothetical protein
VDLDDGGARVIERRGPADSVSGINDLSMDASLDESAFKQAVEIRRDD